jgi:aspartyl-tRNA(Asn)/glutamyl-tRNA(Gln) amidotransferase subunit C
MKIEDLQVTAQLAHLSMDEKELAAAFPAFEQMLGFFAAMEAADKDLAALTSTLTAVDGGAAPSSSALPQMTGTTRTVGADHFRPDNPSGGLVSETLINNAGDRDGQFIVVPNVL